MCSGWYDFISFDCFVFFWNRNLIRWCECLQILWLKFQLKVIWVFQRLPHYQIINFQRKVTKGKRNKESIFKPPPKGLWGKILQKNGDSCDQVLLYFWSITDVHKGHALLWKQTGADINFIFITATIFIFITVWRMCFWNSLVYSALKLI